jgi:hypothetical protein
MSTAADTFDAWTERVVVDRVLPLTEVDTVTLAEEKPFMPLDMARAERAQYVGEVGKKGGDYVFHFFPSKRLSDIEKAHFADAIGDAFIEVFKHQEKLFSSYDEEMGSWSVRATGFANNLMSDKLVVSVFDVLDRNLE